MKILDLSQSGPDWHIWRSKGIGASDASIIMGVSKYTTREKLMLKKLESVRQAQTHKPNVVMNAAMRRGHNLEPEARKAYEEFTGIKCRPVCVVHDTIDWLRASLDGLSLRDNTTAVEIKCVNHEDHASALSGILPRMYVPQVQHQLACGCSVVHYWSFSKHQRFSMAEKMALVVVKPDKEYIEEMLAMEKLFMQEFELKKQLSLPEEGIF